MSKLNADILQDMFVKEENKEKSRKEIAEFHGISLGSLNNYFAAKKAYNSGNFVNAQNVSRQLFIDWARKYGNHGDPVFKTEEPGRSHRKKVEQQQINLDEVHDEDFYEDQKTINKIKAKEEEIHHMNVARRATAICAILMRCDRWSMENEVVEMRMPFSEFIEIADCYMGSGE